MPYRVPKKRQYSDEEKAVALTLLAANKGNMSRTARELGMPLTTLEHWRNGENRNSTVPKLERQKKGQLAGALRGLAMRILELTNDKDIIKSGLVQRATAAAIAVDRSLLLDGDGNSISKSESDRKTLLAKVDAIMIPQQNQAFPALPAPEPVEVKVSEK
jgi:transposase-like protein